MQPITENFIIDQYIKRVVPIGMKRLTPVVYYDAETFVDLFLNKNYMISNFGRIYSKHTNMILLPNVTSHNYERIKIIHEGKSRNSFAIDDLVMMTFAYRQDYTTNSDFFIKHINGNRRQNVYCPGHYLHNLEWSDNINYLNYMMNILPKDDDEEFRPLIIDKRYLISNKGKIFSLITDTFLMHKIDNGYCRVNLADGKLHLVHRLVMMTFAYRSDYENLQVNHIDGNKLNNSFFGEGHPNTNLEWCTDMENRVHAAKTGLTSHGENHYASIFTDEFIENICILLNAQPFMNSNEIAAILNIECNSQFKSLISQLRCGVRWKCIVEKYPNICKVEHASKYTEQFVRDVCEAINNNPKMTAPNLAQILNIEYTEQFQRLVHKLKNGETWKQVATLYPNVIKSK